MTARILDGVATAEAIYDSLRPRIEAVTRAAGRPPGLGIVLAGDNPGSEIYIRNKMRAGAAIGVRVDLERLPATASWKDVLSLVTRLNESRLHDGIIVQSPLPVGIRAEDARRVFDAIDPTKDVDAFTSSNVGRLVQNRATLLPCTPAGVIEVLQRSAIEMAGARAVVIGRSDIVGKPLALMLLHRDATVTVCHSKTPDLPAIASTADILVAAIGRPAFVRRQFVKPGATVIDVGINRVTDSALVKEIFPEDSPRRAEFDRRGSIVVGDVHPEVAAVAGAMTPVTGGVGPITVAMLLTNTVLAAEIRHSLR